MGACSVPGCKKRTESKYQIHQGHIQFFRFPFPSKPAEATRRRKWIANLQYHPNWKPAPHSLVCERHFESKMFFPRASPKAKKYLKSDAVPTITYQLKLDHTYQKKPQSGGATDTELVASQNDRMPEIPTMLMTTPDPVLTILPIDLDNMGEVEVETSCHDCRKYLKEIHDKDGLIIELKEKIESMRKKSRSKGTMTRRQKTKDPTGKVSNSEKVKWVKCKRIKKSNGQSVERKNNHP